MKENIKIIEKPDWVSWDDIKQCLVLAHAENRAKGIVMSSYQGSADNIHESLGVNGKMYVALLGDIVVGVAGLGEKNYKRWYGDRCAYLCYAGVRPEYRGMGFYQSLTEKREMIAKEMGYEVVVFDTHKDNVLVQEIAQRNGYKKVRFFKAKTGDHYNVVMAKWLNGCRYSELYCKWKYYKSKTQVYFNSVFHHQKK